MGRYHAGILDTAFSFNDFEKCFMFLRFLSAIIRAEYALFMGPGGKGEGQYVCSICIDLFCAFGIFT